MRSVTDAERSFLGARFRASALFALVAHDDLAAAERTAFASLVGQGDYFGLLLPEGSLPLSAKTVGHDTATLLRALRQPGLLPAALRDDPSQAQQRALLELVIDGILEIETAEGFVCGPRAAANLHGDSPDEPGAGSGLQRLSLQALRYAAALPDASPLALAARLYHHHTAPLTPEWQQRWAGLVDARERLGLDAGGPLGATLFEHYTEVGHPAWHQWHRSDLIGTAPTVTLPFKLYVSPHPDSLAWATRRAVEALVRARVPAFKLVRGGLGLLRPDKLVAYLQDRTQLEAAVALMAPALAGCRAQGVPFSCAITDDGLLSWGSDPPDGHRLLDWQRIESWRSWITRRLAFALVQARESGAAPAACCRFALDRLQLEHVDTHTWSPGPEVWCEE